MERSVQSEEEESPLKRTGRHEIPLPWRRFKCSKGGSGAALSRGSVIRGAEGPAIKNGLSKPPRVRPLLRDLQALLIPQDEGLKHNSRTCLRHWIFEKGHSTGCRSLFAVYGEIGLCYKLSNRLFSSVAVHFSSVVLWTRLKCRISETWYGFLLI